MDLDFEGFEITIPSFNGFENGIGTHTNNPLTSTWNRIGINNEDLHVSRASTEISDETSAENMSVGSNSSVNSDDIPNVSEPSIEEPIYQQIVPAVTDNSTSEDLNNSYSLIITQQKSVIPTMILSKQTTSKGRDKFVLEPYGFEYVKGYDSFSKVGGVKIKNHTFLYFRCKNHQKKDIKCKAKLRVPFDYVNSDPREWLLYDKKHTEPAGKILDFGFFCSH